MSGYSEEMDILLNDFQTEYDNILNGQNIEELGFIDLRRLKEAYIALDELQKDLVNRARQNNDGIDDYELADLIIRGRDLSNENDKKLINIQNEIQAKMALFRQMSEEKRDVATKRRRNREALNSLRKTYDVMKSNGVDQSIIDGIGNNISQLEELDKEYTERIEQIKENMNALGHGGKVQLLDDVKKETQGISEDELEEINKEVNEQIENEDEQVLINVSPTRTGNTPSVEPETPNLDNPEMENEDEQILINESPEPEVREGIVDEEIEEELNNEQIVNDEQEKASNNQNEEPKEDQEQEIDPIDQINNMTSNFNSRPMNPQTPVGPTPIINTQSEPEYSRGSLGDYQRRGILPKNLKEEQLVEVCNNLGMNATDLEFKPNSEQLDRLRNDKTIKLAVVNERIAARHQRELDNFGRVQSGYEQMDTTNLGENLTERIERESRRVADSMEDYQEKKDTIEADSVSEHVEFDPKVSDIVTDIRLGALDARSDIVNERLRAQYQKLDEQRQVVSHTKIKRIFSEHRIKKTTERINKLRQKEARISGKQFAIMNDQAQKYIEKKQKELARYQERQRKTQQKVDKVNNMVAAREDAREQIASHEEDLAQTTGTGIMDRLERFQLNRSKEKLERRVRRFDRKLARVDRRAQISFTFDKVREKFEEMKNKQDEGYSMQMK